MMRVYLDNVREMGKYMVYPKASKSRQRRHEKEPLSGKKNEAGTNEGENT